MKKPYPLTLMIVDQLKSAHHIRTEYHRGGICHTEGFKNWEIHDSPLDPLGLNPRQGYLGALGKQLPNFVDANIAPATTTKTYTFTGGALAGDQWAVPLYTARINPAYNALTLISSNVTTNYNALAITLDHHLSRGIQASASYTFSKALDYGMNQQATADTNDQTDPFTIVPDYGLSANNIPQRFVGSITFMPKFAIANRYASLAANGWTVAPVWTVQSGVPYSYGLSSGTSIAGGAATYNGSGGVGGGVVQYVNFRAYPQYASSDVFNGVSPQRDIQRQANIDDVDARVSRAFTYHEKYKLTLSGEAFNGQIYLLHDEKLDRTTNGAGDISRYSSEQLRHVMQRDPVSGELLEPLTRFDDLLAWARSNDVRLMVDLKDTPPADAMKLIRRYGLVHRVILLTFDPKTAKAALKAAPDAQVSMLVRKRQEIDSAIASANGHPLALYLPTIGDDALYAYAHTTGKTVISDALGALDDWAQAKGFEVYRDYLLKHPVDILVTNHPLAFTVKPRWSD